MPPFFQLMNQVNQIQRDPSQIVPLLRQSGRLTDEQMSEIETMKSPEEIGQYLMGNAPQNIVGNIQNNVMNIRNQMK